MVTLDVEEGREVKQDICKCEVLKGALDALMLHSNLPIPVLPCPRLLVVLKSSIRGVEDSTP